MSLILNKKDKKIDLTDAYLSQSMSNSMKYSFHAFLLIQWPKEKTSLKINFV